MQDTKTTVTALVASAWFTNCDPFMSTAFNPAIWNARSAGSKFLQILREDVKDQWEAQDDGEGMSESDFQDDAKWSGVHLMDIEVNDEQLAELGFNEDGSTVDPKDFALDSFPLGYAYLDVA